MKSGQCWFQAGNFLGVCKGLGHKGPARKFPDFLWTFYAHFFRDISGLFAGFFRGISGCFHPPREKPVEMRGIFWRALSGRAL